MSPHSGVGFAVCCCPGPRPRADQLLVGGVKESRSHSSELVELRAISGGLWPPVDTAVHPQAPEGGLGCKLHTVS